MTETITPRRMRASDFDPHILEIFDGYVHGKLSKREFIRQAGRYAAAGVTELALTFFGTSAAEDMAYIGKAFASK